MKKTKTKVGYRDNDNSYSIGIIVKIKGVLALVKFKNGYSRWCRIDNLEEITTR